MATGGAGAKAYKGIAALRHRWFLTAPSLAPSPVAAALPIPLETHGSVLCSSYLPLRDPCKCPEYICRDALTDSDSDTQWVFAVVELALTAVRLHYTLTFGPGDPLNGGRHFYGTHRDRSYPWWHAADSAFVQTRSMSSCW